MRGWRIGLAAVLVVSPQPIFAQVRDVCTVMAANPDWQRILSDVEARWGVSPGTVIAVLDQESRLRADARGQGAGGANPVRNFGYAQANLSTWNWFLRDSRWDGARSRTDFEASAHFVGWHFRVVGRRNGLEPDEVTGNYLVYKLGEGGYRRGAPAASRTLAGRIASNARRLDDSLATCGS